jgi:hypothetical protein
VALLKQLELTGTMSAVDAVTRVRVLKAFLDGIAVVDEVFTDSVFPIHFFPFVVFPIVY